jgi:ribose transport system permease protein
MNSSNVKNSTSESTKAAFNINFEKILTNRTLMAFVGLLILSIMLSVISPYFLTKTNVLNVLRQVSVIAIMAIGMTYVIISDGIDLSVGSVLALASTITALLLLDGKSLAISILAGLAVGITCGFVSGVMIVSKVKMPPFISTLAMMSVARGLTLVITGGMPIYGMPQVFSSIGAGYLWGIPIPVVIMLAVYVVGVYFLNCTRTGLHFFAIGSNENAAHLSGINVAKVRLTAYIISGALSALGGIILSSRISSVEPVAGEGYELDCIAAAVIGGTSMSGGAGSLVGTLIGALVMGVLRNGLNLLDVSTYWQKVVIGVVIAVTVAIGTLRKK